MQDRCRAIRWVLLAAWLAACQPPQEVIKETAQLPPAPVSEMQSAPDTNQTDNTTEPMSPEAPGASDSTITPSSTETSAPRRSGPSTSGALANATSAPQRRQLPIRSAEPAPPPVPAPPAAVRGSSPEPDQNKFYDRRGTAYAMLQKANQALVNFPLDRDGKVDWVRSLDTGLIEPRADIAGVQRMELLDQDIIMPNTKQMPRVLFPHRAHSEWLACSNCHDDLFVRERGANKMDMSDIFRGRYCGVCHDKVAFSTFVCERCHSVPLAVSARGASTSN